MFYRILSLISHDVQYLLEWHVLSYYCSFHHSLVLLTVHLLCENSFFAKLVYTLYGSVPRHHIPWEAKRSIDALSLTKVILGHMKWQYTYPRHSQSLPAKCPSWYSRWVVRRLGYTFFITLTNFRNPIVIPGPFFSRIHENFVMSEAFNVCEYSISELVY